MKVRVRYFAFVKDVTGVSEELIETDCHDVDCLLDQLKSKYGKEFSELLEKGRGGVRVVVLVDGSAESRSLKEGSEVAVFPPPAGGEVVDGAVDLLSAVGAFLSKWNDEVGSLVVYAGIVKGRVEGHEVKELRYEAYKEYTLKRFAEIKDYLKKKYPGLVDIEIIHGIATFRPGQVVFVVMALSRGRKDGIEAVKEAVELVKHTTGIWKLEVRDDGEYWVVAGDTRVRKE
ncbi:MAG: MoaD family protein [Thermoprotei archaeon]